MIDHHGADRSVHRRHLRYRPAPAGNTSRIHLLQPERLHLQKVWNPNLFFTPSSILHLPWVSSRTIPFKRSFSANLIGQREILILSPAVSPAIISSISESSISSFFSVTMPKHAAQLFDGLFHPAHDMRRCFPPGLELLSLPARRLRIRRRPY